MKKLKVAIENLKNYLGEDKHGLALLSSIKNMTIELRQKCQSEASRADNAEAQRNVTTDEAARLRTELAEVKAATVRNEDTLNQCQSALKLARAELESLKTEDANPAQRPQDSEHLDASRVKWLCEKVRKDISKCPAAIGRYVLSNKYQVIVGLESIQSYSVSDIAPDFTNRSMIRLGRFVALHAALGAGATAFEYSKTFITEEMDRPDTLMRKFIQWYHPRNISKSDLNKVEGKLANLKYSSDVRAIGEAAIH